jgi:hypothetical protein
VETGKNDGKTGKKTNAVLGRVLKRLGIISGAVLAIKPVADMINAILQFAVFGIIKYLEWISGGIKRIIEGFETIFGGVKDFGEAAWEYLKKAWNWALDFGEKIWEWIKTAWNWTLSIGEKIWEWIKTAWNWALDFGEKIWEWIKTAWNWALSIGEKIWEWIKTAWNWTLSIGDKIWEFIKTQWKWGLDIGKKLWAWIKQKLGGGDDSGDSNNNGFSGSGFTGSFDSLQDGIITKDGKIIKTHPNDTIIATQTPSLGGGSKNFYFYGVTPKEMLDVIKKELAGEVNLTSRF